MKIVYVILHYNAVDATVECINSIKSIYCNDSEIVVVDNASPNNSGMLLHNTYERESRIHILLSSKNEGFACGNNLGYAYARDRLGADIIVVMNNDVVIIQHEFESNLRKIIETNQNVSIIAPRIINLQGINQNPHRLHPLKDAEIIKSIVLYTIYLQLLRFEFTGKKAQECFARYSSSRSNNTIANKDDNDCYDIIPHGACIVFCNKYVTTSYFAFPPITFLYSEEDILYEYAMDLGYRILYTTSLEVCHLEDVSTNSIKASALEKEKFLAKCVLESKKQVIRYRKKFVQTKRLS